MDTPVPATVPERKRSRRGLLQSHLRLAALVAGVLVGGVLISFVFRLVAIGYLFLSGVPVMDEWQCSKGQAPAVNSIGGRNCFPEGATLPAEYTWDSLGNRPFSCDGRRGWTVIYRNQETDCLRDGIEMPDGWSR